MLVLGSSPTELEHLGAQGARPCEFLDSETAHILNNDYFLTVRSAVLANSCVFGVGGRIGGFPKKKTTCTICPSRLAVNRTFSTRTRLSSNVRDRGRVVVTYY